MIFGDSIWYCSKLKEPDDDGQEYAPPKEIKTRTMYFTVMGKSASSDLIDFGDVTDEKLRCIAQPYRKWANVFKAGDLFYCNDAKPSDDEEWYGQNANYVVDGVPLGNAVVQINLKKVASE